MRGVSLISDWILLSSTSGAYIRVSLLKTALTASHFQQHLIPVEDYHPVPSVALILAVAESLHPKASEPCGLVPMVQPKAELINITRMYLTETL